MQPKLTKHTIPILNYSTPEKQTLEKYGKATSSKVAKYHIHASAETEQFKNTKSDEAV